MFTLVLACAGDYLPSTAILPTFILTRDFPNEILSN